MQRSLIAHADLSFQNARYIPTDSEAERNGQRDNQQGWKQKPYEKTRLERVHRIFQMNYFSEYMQNLVSYRIIQKCPETNGFVRFADRWNVVSWSFFKRLLVSLSDK